MFQGSANFVGREQELRKLSEKLQKPSVVAISAVSGMGGVGKTELATQYARGHEADYPGGICWLSARSSNLALEMVQFVQEQMKLKVPQQDVSGKLLSLSEQVAWCWRNWQPSEGEVLVVLDDVTELGVFREFLPKASRFRVLITTRLRNLDANIQEISLDVLSPEEALELLIALVGEMKVQRELETAKELCEWLGYLPLGLELVGRYVVKKPPNWTLAKMLKRLREQRLSDEAINFQEQQLQQSLSTAQRGVLAAFELSWQSLEEKIQEVAMLLSLFAADIFFWEWVESTSRLLNWVAGDVEKANEQLFEQHLIQWVEQGNCYKIHPLIREFLKVKLASSEQANKLKQTFASTFREIAQTIPESPTQELIKSVKDAIPHLAEVARNLTDAVSDENLLGVFVGLSRFYSGQGLYAIAEPWFEQCILVLKSRLGEEHPDFASSLNELALLYYFQGYYEKAEPLYKRALTLRKKVLGGKHLDFAESLNNLALLYESQGRYEKAEPLYKRSLAIYKKVLGEEHPLFALSLNNLGCLYESQGRYEEAESLYKQALALRKKVLGEEHPDFAGSLNNLGYLYYSQGRYEKAEPLYKRSLGIYTKVLGEEHPSSVNGLGNLGYLYYSQGRYEKAGSLLEQALALTRKVLGEEHPLFAISLNNLANLYNSQERYSEAEKLYKQALAIDRKVLGEEHPSFARRLNNLADLYNSQERYSEAEPLYKQALAIDIKVLREDHSDVATMLNNLAGLYKSTGRYDQAEKMYMQALELRKRRVEEEHPYVAISLSGLAGIYESTGRYNQAEKMYMQASALFKRLLGEEHPYVAISLNNLAEFYKSTGRYNQAEELLVEALKISQQVFGVNHQKTATIRENLESLRDKNSSHD